MSLINEALKKAQRMRVQDSPAAPLASDPASPPPSPSPAATPFRRGHAPGSQTFLFAIVGIPLLIAVCVGATWLLLRPSSEPVVIASQPPPPAALAPAPVAPAPAADVPVISPAPESISISLPLATTSPAPASSTPEPAPAAASQPASPASPIVTPDPKPDPRVNAFLDTLRVSGIRASPTDPRVSMNDRVFRLNDIVDRNLELRIIGIAHEGLTFIDPSGTIYKTQF